MHQPKNKPWAQQALHTLPWPGHCSLFSQKKPPKATHSYTESVCHSKMCTVLHLGRETSHGSVLLPARKKIKDLLVWWQVGWNHGGVISITLSASTQHTNSLFSKSDHLPWEQIHSSGISGLYHIIPLIKQSSSRLKTVRFLPCWKSFFPRTSPLGNLLRMCCFLLDWPKIKKKNHPQQVNGKTVISPWKQFGLPEWYFPLKMFCWRIPNKSGCCITDFNQIQNFLFPFVLTLIFRRRDGYRSASFTSNVMSPTRWHVQRKIAMKTWLSLQPALPRQWHNLSQGCLSSQSPFDLQLFFWRSSFS